MTCASCRHSVTKTADGLWCVLWKRPATYRCAAFEYEPGTGPKEYEREKPAKPD